MTIHDSFCQLDYDNWTVHFNCTSWIYIQTSFHAPLQCSVLCMQCNSTLTHTHHVLCGDGNHNERDDDEEDQDEAIIMRLNESELSRLKYHFEWFQAIYVIVRKFVIRLMAQLRLISQTYTHTNPFYSTPFDWTIVECYLTFAIHKYASRSEQLSSSSSNSFNSILYSYCNKKKCEALCSEERSFRWAFYQINDDCTRDSLQHDIGGVHRWRTCMFQLLRWKHTHTDVLSRWKQASTRSSSQWFNCKVISSSSFAVAVVSIIFTVNVREKESLNKKHNPILIMSFRLYQLTRQTS